MSLHENEHSGKSVRRAVEHGTGNHFARISSQARRNPNSPHARAEQIGNANTQRKVNMQTKTNTKKQKKHNKLQDLKPPKDPKGGIPPGPCGPGGSNLPAVQGPRGSN